MTHYENFPVASLLLPKKLRRPIAAIYRFAREADDLADEGDADTQTRLAALNALADDLEKIRAGMPPLHPASRGLVKVIADHSLPMEPLKDLLSAFCQDVAQNRYTDFQVLRDYCRRSANPVGHLVLHLNQQADEQNLRDADAICTALQLINFLQDIHLDWQKGRLYLPQNELALFDLSETDIKQMAAGGLCPARWNKLMSMQTRRARELLLSGRPLLGRLSGRLRWEIHLTLLGGLCILDKIEQVKGDVFRHRPVLTRSDWLVILWRMVRGQDMRKRPLPTMRPCQHRSRENP